MHLVRVGAHGRAKKVISLRQKVNLVFALHPWFASWYCINSLPLVSIWIPSVVLSEMMECTCNCWAPPEMSDCRSIDEKQSSLEAYGMMVKGSSMDRGSGAFFFFKALRRKLGELPAALVLGPLNMAGTQIQLKLSPCLILFKIWRTKKWHLLEPRK